MHDENADSYGRTEASDPWNDDKRKAYAKRLIKESKDLPAHFRRPDYKANMDSPASEKPAEQAKEEMNEAPAPQEKKKEKYEL